jgi:hypothetical protein
MWSALEVPVNGKMPTARVMTEHLTICSQQRESLIDDLALVAKRSYFAIPSEAGKASVLDEGREFGVGGLHLLKVQQRDIAHPQ